MIAVLISFNELSHLPSISHIKVLFRTTWAQLVRGYSTVWRSAYSLNIIQSASKEEMGHFNSLFPGKANVWADQLSRSAPIATEGELDKASFHRICKLTVPPQFDSFATWENRKLASYISLRSRTISPGGRMPSQWIGIGGIQSISFRRPILFWRCRGKTKQFKNSQSSRRWFKGRGLTKHLHAWIC